ncbi:mammalian cell entry protein [Mycobacterium bourgelatii]|uniref:Mammalian cell entry protein n=1 Tax=Mycobacterium bourgelatii TaxID=1273442 RepID=A0A7I9YZM2_MYCBU|nr:mammalian cell entry protein [Mycobacterium bourgelatii]MCV6976626.1 mammalian cell entry protein [Mycobacterium bourgelatii]GFG94075.1 hypothetical protein MBOU_61170 [Mycobacterium bourgelatii]
MSPRRKFRPGEQTLLAALGSLPRRSWRLLVIGVVTGIVMATAMTLSSLLFASQESHDRAVRKEHEVVDFVKLFMEQFTSVDPYHANEYVERVLSHATGDFAKEYHDKANQILLQVAQAEPATGTVTEVGVERWNDDGSVNILVVTEFTSKSPDGKQVYKNTNRWATTAKQEGNQWKISKLDQVV